MTDKLKNNVKVYESPAALTGAAAALFAELYDASVAEKGYFTAVLSGGKTPEGIFAALASGAFMGRIDWSRVHLFWGDERNVPMTDKDSNFRSAFDSLIAKVDIPEENIHRIRTEMGPKAAAADYEGEILLFFTDKEKARFIGGVPSFDLVFLGLGADGHTLSLFPGTLAVDEGQRLVTDNFVGRLDCRRITMTARLVNAASNCVFLAAGKDKAAILRDVLDKSGGVKYPARMISPLSGSLRWLVDKDAASLL